MDSSGEDDPTRRAKFPRFRGAEAPGDTLPQGGQLPGRPRWEWPLTATETVLLAFTVAIFVLGTIFNLGERAMTVAEPWQVDELLLALPLLTLVLALVLHRRTTAWRHQDARYRTLVEQLPAVIYILSADEQATRLYFSPYVTRLTGYTPEEALAQGDHWLDWVHPADRDRVMELDAETAAAGAVFRAEYRHLRKDGTYVWVLDECVPVRNDEGDVIAWQGVVLDITSRIESEEAQARLAAIVDSAEDAIISSDLDTTVTSWNRGAEKLYGYTAQEMVGRSMTVLMPEGKFEGSLAARVAATRAGDPGETFEAVRQRRDGSLVDVTVSLFPIRDHAGNVMGLSSITRDITAWKHAEEQLEIALEAAQAANETKSQFLAMMSHELRTPLQAILGYTEFLLSNPASKLTTEEREDLGYIQQGGLRMLALINQLLDLSRLEAGRLEVERKPVNLSEVLELVRQDVAPQANKKHRTCKSSFPRPSHQLSVILNGYVRSCSTWLAMRSSSLSEGRSSSVRWRRTRWSPLRLPTRESVSLLTSCRRYSRRFARWIVASHAVMAGLAWAWPLPRD